MPVTWSCYTCNSTFESGYKFCPACHSMLYYHCSTSETTGLYSHYSRHQQHCEACWPGTARQFERPYERKEHKVEVEMNRMDRGTKTFPKTLHFGFCFRLLPH